jgi:hypothetical protein
MSRALPPNPNDFIGLEEWARKFYEFYLSQVRYQEENDPLPILLAHRSNSVMERAAVDGLFLYDPTYETPVVSEQGEWEPTRTKSLFSLNYDTAFNVDGATISTGGDKIPFDALATDGAPWAVFDAVNNDFDLVQGQYNIEGFVSITKISGGEKTFTGYLAESTDLTTPVGTVKMGSLVIPSNAANEATFVVPFRGQVSVPSGGGTYAMVVNTADSDTRFGTAHGISGYENIYARLAISLIGLNE